MSRKLIAYYRVSTLKQGVSGLGLEGQAAAVAAYAASIGGEVVRSYQEVESGGRDDRPELQRAIADAKRSKATIVVGKLDRLSRDVHLISGLQRGKVPFVACDMPDADETMIGVYAYFGQRELKMISTRTKDALAVYKATRRVSKRIQAAYPDGVPAEVVEATAGKLGACLPQCRNLTDEGRARGRARSIEVRQARAAESVSDLAPVMMAFRASGLSLQAIADRLNDDGHVTRTGKPWNKMQVSRVLER